MKRNAARKIFKIMLACLTLSVLAIGWKYHFMAWIVPLAMLAGVLGVLILGNRFVCGNICPRGAFLDIFVSKVSANKTAPSFMSGNLIKIIVLVLLFGFFGYNVFNIGNYALLPLLFWKMCFYTTLLGLFLAFFINQRAWCMICPVGSIGGWLTRNKARLRVAKSCVGCKSCDKVCPAKINPSSFKGGKITHINCVRCGECKRVCPVKAIK